MDLATRHWPAVDHPINLMVAPITHAAGAMAVMLAAQGATGHKKARRGSKAAATDGERVRRSAAKGAAERQLVAGAEEVAVVAPDDMEEI